MATGRFHKAAKDGLVDVLKEATKRDCNAVDESGMTPTLYAAFNGHLDTLRLLCGRGGDPDKADYFGNTALHLAAAQGHKAIVTFLVNFGVNIYAMNIDERTPQELAGMHSKEEILRYLDGVSAKIDATDKKKAKSMKEKAKKNAEKIIKEFNKRQSKLENSTLKQKRIYKEHKPSVMSTLKFRMKSGSTSNLTNVGQTAPRNSFSAIVSGGTMSRNMTSAVQKKAFANKLKSNISEDDFKVSEIEDGKRSVRSLRGFRRDSEVMYGGTLDVPKRGRLDGVFNGETDRSPSTLTRSLSQPDIMHELNNNEDHMQHEPGSIFNRPGVGTIAFRKSIITNPFHASTMTDATIEDSSIGSAGSLAVRQRQFGMTNFADDLSESESSEEDNPNFALERFLTAWELGEYLPKFNEQEIDLNTLMLLTESDLKSLNLPLGPYRKLVTAISERKAALENPGEVTDSAL